MQFSVADNVVTTKTHVYACVGAYEVHCMVYVYVQCMYVNTFYMFADVSILLASLVNGIESLRLEK